MVKTILTPPVDISKLTKGSKFTFKTRVSFEVEMLENSWANIKSKAKAFKKPICCKFIGSLESDGTLVADLLLKDCRVVLALPSGRYVTGKTKSVVFHGDNWSYSVWES